MPLLDIARKTFAFAAAYRAQKIADMRRGVVLAATRHFVVVRQLALLAEVYLIARVIERHVSFAAEEEVTDKVAAFERDAALAAGMNAADLEHKLRIAIVKRRQQGVGCFLIVVVNKFAAG